MGLISRANYFNCIWTHFYIAASLLLLSVHSGPPAIKDHEWSVVVKPVATKTKFDLSLILLDSTSDVWPLLNMKTILLKPNEPLYFKSLTLWISSASCNTAPWVQNQVGNRVQNLSLSYRQPDQTGACLEWRAVMFCTTKQKIYSCVSQHNPFRRATDSSHVLGKKNTLCKTEKKIVHLICLVQQTFAEK